MRAEVDAAFEWLDRAIEQRDLGLPGLPTDRRFRALRDDPRYADVLGRCECVPEPDSPL